MKKGTLTRYSWAMIIRGIIAILFGVLALFWPDITIELLVFLFAFYVLFDGIIAIIAAISSMAHHKQWWAFLLEGLLGIAAGIFALILPAVTLFVLIYIIAAWAVITGLMEIIAVFSVGWDEGTKLLIGLAGLVSIILGLIIFLYPSASLLVLSWLIGIYALLFGILLMIFGVQVKKMDT